MSSLPDPLNKKIDQTTSSYSGSLGTKEKETLIRQDEASLEAVRQEIELTPEIKKVVEIRQEEIELPPPLPKMGVTQTGADLSVNLSSVNLPLADEKILSSRKAPITDNLRWFAEWCLKQLRKVHIKLKKENGRIVRVKT
ncbi:MAG: hypothetical protein M1575_03380 [Patescibacteria group bacterium]|nr:hypothetical protein [Patescibacteria group bacterium]MCL5095741.1 hypothetical protein [Patescibacteria group bacterium]